MISFYWHISVQMVYMLGKVHVHITLSQMLLSDDSLTILLKTILTEQTMTTSCHWTQQHFQCSDYALRVQFCYEVRPWLFTQAAELYTILTNHRFNSCHAASVIWLTTWRKEDNFTLQWVKWTIGVYITIGGDGDDNMLWMSNFRKCLAVKKLCKSRRQQDSWITSDSFHYLKRSHSLL